MFAKVPDAEAGNALLDRATLRRLALGLILAEQSDLIARGQMSRPLRPQPQDAAAEPEDLDDLRIDEEGFGFDSLSRLSLVLRFNQFFQLSQTGIEDHLFLHARLGDWVSLLQLHLSLMAERASFAFSSSGTAGPAKQTAHLASDLLAEVQALRSGPLSHLSSDSRVLTLVPSFHIYGFLFSCLLPGQLGKSVLDLTRSAPTAAIRLARPDDLVVATPLHWRALLESGLTFPKGVSGLTSAGPATFATWSVRQVTQLTTLTEIYGSTETAGIGTRSDPDSPFHLMPHLTKTRHGGVRVQSTRSQKLVQDHIEWVDERRFFLRGRKDESLKIAGINVSPRHIAQVLCACDGVADAHVRPGNERLKAYIVPTPGEDRDTLQRRLQEHILRELPAPARPTDVTFGEAIPVNAMGKLCDWPSNLHIG